MGSLRHLIAADLLVRVEIEIPAEFDRIGGTESEGIGDRCPPRLLRMTPGPDVPESAAYEIARWDFADAVIRDSESGCHFLRSRRSHSDRTFHETVDALVLEICASRIGNELMLVSGSSASLAYIR
jgi:hypothetical protein